MKPTTILAVTFSTLLLAGCAAPKAQWSHPTKPASQFAADEEYCRIEAETKVPPPPVPETKVNLEGLARIFSILGQKNRDSRYDAEVRHHMGDCLQQKGWVLKSGQ